ncbi:hypothetical protein ElyMa_006702300 [Elysia marginata]|uniref:DDE Tnp4 domain-containing protein n=1 Tax=Elysia marginata TaxID=1093978 RepID=A0AAV4IPW5_9GAST|nr:hypothetical protein ElyMa_006702300 [Elysia marginata]
MIVGDEVFPLKTYLWKPYAAETLDYRHSRARRTVECAFGILAKKFEIFQRPLRVEPDKGVLLTNAALVLHNFIRRRDGRMVDRTSDVTYEVVEGQGRGMFPLEAPTHGGRSSAETMAIRDSVKTFSMTRRGELFPGSTKTFSEMSLQMRSIEKSWKRQLDLNFVVLISQHCIPICTYV